MENVDYRKALPDEYKILSKLAYESEAYWQYSEAFMKNFKAQYSVTEEWIDLNPVRVLEIEASILGFWGAIVYGEKIELLYFYIKVEYIGKGYGQLLWQDLLRWCKQQNILEIEFVTSKQVVSFYKKQGAEIIGETKSEVDGRAIPLLRYIKKG